MINELMRQIVQVSAKEDELGYAVAVNQKTKQELTLQLAQAVLAAVRQDANIRLLDIFSEDKPTKAALFSKLDKAMGFVDWSKAFLPQSGVDRSKEVFCVKYRVMLRAAIRAAIAMQNVCPPPGGGLKVVA